jgi:hypothetical protein
MKTLTTTAALFSLLFSTLALASQTDPAPEVPETLVGQPSAIRTQLSGWFIAPTFTTTSFANSVAYGPGLRAGIYLNRRLALGITGTALALQESHFGDSRATNVGTYGGLLVQYVVHSNSLVHVNVESTVGSGRWCTEVSDGKDGRADGCSGRNFFAFEPVANVEVNVSRHMRIDTGIGYRFAIAQASGTGPDGGDMSGLVARTSLVFGSF